MTINCSEKGHMHGTFKLRLIGRKNRTNDYKIQLSGQNGVGTLSHFVVNNKIKLMFEYTTYHIRLINKNRMQGSSHSCEINIKR